MKPSLIHLEHGLPALAELGIEHLLSFLGGGVFDASVVGAALQGLAGGAEKRAARALVAISKATGAELLAWEGDSSLRDRALKEAALLPFDDAKQAVMDFFSSLGAFQVITPTSSEPVKTPPADPQTDSAPVH